MLKCNLFSASTKPTYDMHWDFKNENAWNFEHCIEISYLNQNEKKLQFILWRDQGDLVYKILFLQILILSMQF